MATLTGPVPGSQRRFDTLKKFAILKLRRTRRTATATEHPGRLHPNDRIREWPYRITPLNEGIIDLLIS